MTDEIPQELVDRMMVKCGRCCCICRRFRPTKLQVHHIRERSQGGGNEEDNLIVACFSCHSDVHTKVPFARRFSQEELKGHRNALVKMVEEGKLATAADTNDADEVMDVLLRTPSKLQVGLSPEATEILLWAVKALGVEQGSVMLTLDSEGASIKMGNSLRVFADHDRRTQARYKRAVQQLVDFRMLQYLSEDVLEVTDEGYFAADEILASQAQATPGPSTAGQ